MERLHPDVDALQRRLAELEFENIDLTVRALSAEGRLAHTAQLYAAVAQLHQAEDTDGVILVIKEIVTNLLGCEEVGIYDVYPPGPICTYVDGVGLDPSKHGSFPATHPLGRQLFATRAVVIADNPDDAFVAGLPVSAIVPLLDGSEICGLVVLFRLLRQKPALVPSDHPLLEALGTHGGRALLHARWRQQRP